MHKCLFLLTLLGCAKSPSSLDISQREVDCGFILLKAVNRGDLKLTGMTITEKGLQYDRFQEDCLEMTLDGYKSRRIIK